MTIDVYLVGTGTLPHYKYNVEERELSAINQFARAMPLLFEGIVTMSMGTETD